MPNRHRGEVEACFNGTRYTLCLTLGALAELEEALKMHDLQALGERFKSGVPSARDLMAILKAGLRGGGHTLSDAQLNSLQHEEGLSGVMHTVLELLQVTFGDSKASMIAEG
jgi:hypothetical protein